MAKNPDKGILGTSQSDVDLMFWQYIQGVKDAVQLDQELEGAGNPIGTINDFIKKKLDHIRTLHKKEPSFDLEAKMMMGKIEIIKKRK